MTTVVLFSGGADSATLLRSTLDPIALSFDYGQTHRVELDYAQRFCVRFGIPHHIIPLPHNLFSGSALTHDIPMPEGHYTDESMRKTVVPNRNMVMLSIAVSVAIQKGAQFVAYAAHKDDRGIYPDCRPAFIQAIAEAVAKCDWNPPTLLAPFQDLSKREIVAKGRALGLDYSLTWSCYAGGDKPCGKCGACSAREVAMAA